MQKKTSKILFPFGLASTLPQIIDHDYHTGILGAEKELLCLNVPERNAVASNRRSLSVLRPSFPAAETLHVMDALSCECNLNCVYCPLRKAAAKPSGLTPGERISIWQEVFSAFRAGSFALTLFGGEPFLDIPYLQKLFTLAEEKKLPVSRIGIVTNGTIATPEVIDLINRHHVHSLRITLDGPRNIHNARRLTRNGEDGYCLILDNISTFLSRTAVAVIINTVLDRRNIRCYEQMVDELIARFASFATGKSPRITFSTGGGCLP